MTEPVTNPRRSAVFARADIRQAAEEFVVAISEHAELVWHQEDIDQLADQLTDKAFVVLRDEEATF